MTQTSRRTAVASAILLFTAGAVAQVTIRQVPIENTVAGSGQEMYQAYCASCHGEDGKGKGPAAPALKTPATDLTKLAQNNGGVYPTQEVIYTLGLMPGATRAHGTDDMPVWGTLFRSLGQHPNVVQIRLYNLTRYIESLQDPPAQAPKPKAQQQPRQVFVTEVFSGSGSAMYQSYCSSCHGMDGTGNGPASHSLKKPAPDLTMLAKHNGGKFPGMHVQSVLGWSRGSQAAHGSQDMPVWGNLFRSGRDDESIVQLRIRNLTSYVESLQR